MALEDIIGRIESDAGHEALEIRRAAEQEAERILADARSAAEREHAATMAQARKRAATEAATLLANARLRARDATVSRRSALVEQALSRVEETLATGMPDADYVALISRELARTARAGDRVLLGAEDATRLRAALPAAMKAQGAPELDLAEEPAPFPRGVLLEGDRSTADISPRSLADARRDDLVAAAAAVLFPEGSDA